MHWFFVLLSGHSLVIDCLVESMVPLCFFKVFLASGVASCIGELFVTFEGHRFARVWEERFRVQSGP
jgi:hypothetical protein